MNSCNCLSGCELVTLASTLSCIISKNLNTDDMSILASFLSALGDNLATIAAVQSTCESNSP